MTRTDFFYGVGSKNPESVYDALVLVRINILSCWKMTIEHCSRSSRVGRRGDHELPSWKGAGFVLFSDIVPGTYSKLTGQNLLWATICTRSDTQQLHYIVAHRRVSVASNLLPCYVELESIDVNIVRVRRQPGYFAQHSPGADSTKDRFPS